MLNGESSCKAYNHQPRGNPHSPLYSLIKMKNRVTAMTNISNIEISRLCEKQQENERNCT